MTKTLDQSVADSSFQRAAAQLPVADVEQAANHYRDRFGFTIGGIWHDVPYAIVHRGGVEIHFCRDEHTGRPKQGGAYLVVDDADAVYEDLVARGAAPVNRPEDRFYGRREFAVRDLDGYLISLSSPVANEDAG